METWGRLLQDAATNGLGDHEPKNLIETSLWQAWVAWMEGGQQILGTGIHRLFTTQTSTLIMFVLDCNSQLNISLLRTLWSLHELNVFAKQREREWIPETIMSNKSFFGSALHFCEHGQLKGWPRQKPSRNFTVKGMSCLDRGRTANFGYRKFTAKDHSNPSLIRNSYFESGDVRAGL